MPSASAGALRFATWATSPAAKTHSSLVRMNSSTTRPRSLARALLAKPMLGVMPCATTTSSKRLVWPSLKVTCTLPSASATASAICCPKRSVTPRRASSSSKALAVWGSALRLRMWLLRPSRVTSTPCSRHASSALSATIEVPLMRMRALLFALSVWARSRASCIVLSVLQGAGHASKPQRDGVAPVAMRQTS